MRNDRNIRSLNGNGLNLNIVPNMSKEYKVAYLYQNENLLSCEVEIIFTKYYSTSCILPCKRNPLGNIRGRLS